MPRKRLAPKQEMLQVRIHRDLRLRAQALLRWTSEQPDLSPSGAAELTDVYRHALHIGLTEMEQRAAGGLITPSGAAELNINNPPVAYPVPEPAPVIDEPELATVVDEPAPEPDEIGPFQRLLDGDKGAELQREACDSLDALSEEDPELEAAQEVWIGLEAGTLKRNIRKTGRLYKALEARFSS